MSIAISLIKPPKQYYTLSQNTTHKSYVAGRIMVFISADVQMSGHIYLYI